MDSIFTWRFLLSEFTSHLAWAHRPSKLPGLSKSIDYIAWIPEARNDDGQGIAFQLGAEIDEMRFYRSDLPVSCALQFSCVPFYR